jgi:branched-chain amino acid transport system ATP-binding protein
MLKVNNLETGYGESQVLFDISFTVEKGEIVTLVGSNAAGKSTIINSICGIIKPWKGTVIFLDKDITDLPEKERVEMGLIQSPEGRRLFPGMSVYENLILGSYCNRAKPMRKENLEKVYGLFPILYERRNQAAGSLSGGEQQMCTIGRSLMAIPELLILDEPSLGLSPLLVDKIFEIISNISGEGVTILLVEQNVNQALSIASKGFVIESGRLVLSGSGKDLLENDQLRAAYLGI